MTHTFPSWHYTVAQIQKNGPLNLYCQFNAPSGETISRGSPITVLQLRHLLIEAEALSNSTQRSPQPQSVDKPTETHELKTCALGGKGAR